MILHVIYQNQGLFSFYKVMLSLFGDTLNKSLIALSLSNNKNTDTEFVIKLNDQSTPYPTGFREYI